MGGGEDEPEMKEDYDAIIVGAGPAGCSAAISLGRLGHEVLLMDKAKFPREKVCGDGIGPLALEALDRLGIYEAASERNPWRVEGIDFFSPAGQKVRTSFSHLRGRYRHGWIFPRREFDLLLWEHARSYPSVHVLEGCEGKDLVWAGGRIVGVLGKRGESLEEFRGKVIIGADGAYSFVSKRISSPGRIFRNYSLAVRGYFRQVKGLTHQIEIHCERHLLPGYGWVFPTGEGEANVGVGIASRSLKKEDLKEMFRVFIEGNQSLRERFREARLVKDTFGGWPIPLAGPATRRSRQNVLLLGDAARFADVLSGEGIFYALQSGECAAQAIHQGLSMPRAQERIGEIYEKLWKGAFGLKEYWIGNLLQRLIIRESFLDWNVGRAGKNPVMARNLASILCHEKTKLRLLF
jgi:geranylgeranyl reductase family protein